VCMAVVAGARGRNSPPTPPRSFMSKYHYVYCSYEEWGRDYIGVRSCNCLPEEDIGYFGSFYDKTFKPTGKVILFVCETRQEVLEIEIKLHDFFDVAVNPQFANKAKATSTKFDVTGVPNTEEAKRKKSESKLGEKNPMFGMYGEKNPMYGVPQTEAQKKAQSEKMSGEKHPQYGKFGAAHNRSKAIIAIAPDDTQRHYGSIIEAARDLEIPQGHLSSRYLKPGKQPKQGKWAGWQFFYENSEVLH